MTAAREQDLPDADVTRGAAMDPHENTPHDATPLDPDGARLEELAARLTP